MRQSSRRRFVSTLVAVGLAGCLGGDSNTTDTTSETTPTSDRATTTPTRPDSTSPTPSSTGSEQRTDTETAAPTITETETRTRKTATETTQTPTETQGSLFPDYGKTEVSVVAGEDDVLGTVTAAIAETSEEWTIGLSETESMPEEWGMLFVDDTGRDRTFWMKDMDFGLDMIFIDEDRQITEIHHAAAPGPDEDGTEQLYSGYAQYILEVNYEWTTRHDVLVNDMVEFTLPD